VYLAKLKNTKNGGGSYSCIIICVTKTSNYFLQDICLDIFNVLHEPEKYENPKEKRAYFSSGNWRFTCVLFIFFSI
jgi:hypothetical protein